MSKHKTVLTYDAMVAKLEFERVCEINREAMRQRDMAIVSKIEKGGSMAAVGREFGLTRERVRQIYIKKVATSPSVG